MKKILFHGNCQSSVVAKWFVDNYSNKYQIINCKECGLLPSWGRGPSFSLWTKQNIETFKDRPKALLAVQEKVKEADIFVFMHHTTTFDEINSISLHNNVAQGLKICLPNSRFGAYPICRYSLRPYINYIELNITDDPIKIAEYIKNEDDPVFTELLYKQYPFTQNTERSLSQNPLKYKECAELYDNAIPINDFVEKNWKDHLLFNIFNHPTEMYYRELISSLLTNLGEDLDLLKNTKNIRHPKGEGTGEVININEFAFFKKHVCRLSIPSGIKLKSFQGAL